MGAKSAGAHVVPAATRLLLGAAALAAVLAACTSGELAEGDLRPAPIASQSFGSPTSTPVPTRAPTATPTPTLTPMPVPEPSPTPTGEELYGPLLVPGQYDWPLEMPDDLTEDELLAINIFASWQNVRYAAFRSSDASAPEVDTIQPYVSNALLDLLDDNIATYRTAGKLGSAPQPDNEWIKVEIADRFASGLVLRTCEHVDTVVTEIISGAENRAFGTSFRQIEYALDEDTVQLLGWSAEEVNRDEFSCVS